MKNTENHRSDGENQLDDLFRERLKNYKQEPSYRLWKGIDRKLLMKELVRLNLTNLSKTFWIVGAAAVVITGAILFYTLPGKMEPPSGIPETEKQIPAQKQAKPETKTILTGKTGNEKIEDQSVNNEMTTSVKPVQPPSGKVRPIEIATSKTGSQQEAGTVRKIPVTEPAAPIVSEVPKTRLTPEQLSEKTSAANETNIRVAVTMQSRSSEGIEIQRLISRKVNIDIDQPPFPIQPVEPNPMPEELKTRIPPPSFYSLGLGITPEISFYKTTSSYTNYDFWLGLDFAYHFGNFYIKPGIGYGIVNDNGNYMVSYKRFDSIGFYYHVTSYTIDPVDPSKIIYHYSTRTIMDSISHIGNEKTSNRYQYFQVPVLLGFNLVETPRFCLAMQAGPGVSLLVSQKETHVEYIRLSNSTVTERVNQTPSRVTVNWQVWGGVHMEYRFKEKLSFMVEPTVKYYLKPVSDNPEIPAESPWVVGINLGLQYNFGFKNAKK